MRKRPIAHAPIALLIITQAACFGSESVKCSWGGICAEGLVCHEPSRLCLLPEQVMVCEGMDELDSCEYEGSGHLFRCRWGACLEPYCGDGILDPDEECDDGELNSDVEPDVCRTDCANHWCGDGVVDVGALERCDDGNNVSFDGCAADCSSDESCGNNVLDETLGEACDDGNNVSLDGCAADCSSDESCGNGVLDTSVGEVCDDGNTSGGDGCSTDCICEDTTALAHGLPVDIIFVIDNSGSMTNEILSVQANINSNFTDILANSGLDYRVIMLSRHGEANVGQAICISAPLSGTDCNPAPSQPANTSLFFHYSKEVGSNNSLCNILTWFDEPDEFSLAPNGYSEWLRPVAFKVFIELTDDGVSCADGSTILQDGDSLQSGQTAAAAFDAALLQLSPTQFGTAAQRKYLFYSIVCQASPPIPTDPWLPTDPATITECNTGCEAPGTGYQFLSILTGGLRFAFCEFNAYDQVFTHIASSLVQASFCQLAVPPDTVPTELGLLFTPGNGPAEYWTRANTMGDCTGEQWYFDDNVDPTAMMLCPDACSRITDDPAGQIETVYCI